MKLLEDCTDSASIYNQINAAANQCPVSPIGRTKLTGALAIEVIRDRLNKAGLPVSARDVFIKGCPTEFDLLITRPSAKPTCGIVYDATDVAAVLEIKFSGVYSQNVPIKLRQLFDDIKSINPHIQCAYLTVCENPAYKYRMTNECLGSTAFTLNWWANYKRITVKPGNGFNEVIQFASAALSKLPN